ncbi:MAG: pyruvate ferredoxin oxidoreductase [Deltaproteobacteria bacterium]|nr:pyruvate ferredoxin oxidoreductase [Deltaproteobacteria bacterium]
MNRRVGMEVSLAVAEAVKMADTDAIAAYPITPQTHIVERLSEFAAEGELHAAYIPVESEHSAISVCAGTSASGARTFTATSSQGLALMHEILYIIASMRLPVVMAVVNRALSAPINIWSDLSDVMSQRDTGWIVLFAESGQEAFDLTLQAFRAAEDPRVLLPVMVNVDGFSLSHVIESIELPELEAVREFLPTYSPRISLDPDHPVSIGAFAPPEVYTNIKYQQDRALRESRQVLEEVWEQFGRRFGRRHRAVECHRIEDAETVLMTMGSVCSTASVAVDRMRREGKRVGLLKVKLWRPFPAGDLMKAIRFADNVVVVDRALSFGGQGGPLALEVKSASYSLARRPRFVEYIAGIGGLDLRVEDFQDMVEGAYREEIRENPPFSMVGVTE